MATPRFRTEYVTTRATRIAGIEAVTVQLPVRRDWRWRGMEGSLGRWVLVRVHTVEGLVGLGEATPLPDWGGDFNRYAGETPETVRHVVTDLLAPAVAGLDSFQLQVALDRMDRAIRGHFYAKSAVEMALIDLQGKVTGQPAYRLLGGMVRESVPIAHMIGLMSREEAAEEAAAVAKEGVRALQIKGTGQLAEDLAVVGAVRAAVDDTVVLRFDANQGYRGRATKDAVTELRRLIDAGVDLIEQPTEGLRGMAELREALGVTVIADESVWQPADVIDAAQARAADAVSVYIAKAGGITRAHLTAALCQQFGLPCDVNGSLEGGVGNAANLHFALSAPNVTLPSVIPVTTLAGGDGRAGRYFTDDVVTRSMTLADGALLPPDGPGLGVELDMEKVSTFRVDD